LTKLNLDSRMSLELRGLVESRMSNTGRSMVIFTSRKENSATYYARLFVRDLALFRTRRESQEKMEMKWS
jgi:hypothetical protein